VSGMLTQYFTEMLNIASQTGNAELIKTFSDRALIAGTEIAKQMLASFDVKNIEKILPLELLNPGALNAEQPADPSGNNGVEGDNEVGSMVPSQKASTAPATLQPGPLI